MPPFPQAVPRLGGGDERTTRFDTGLVGPIALKLLADALFELELFDAEAVRLLLLAHERKMELILSIAARQLRFGHFFSSTAHTEQT